MNNDNSNFFPSQNVMYSDRHAHERRGSCTEEELTEIIQNAWLGWSWFSRSVMWVCSNTPPAATRAQGCRGRSTIEGKGMVLAFHVTFLRHQHQENSDGCPLNTFHTLLQMFHTYVYLLIFFFKYGYYDDYYYWDACDGDCNNTFTIFTAACKRWRKGTERGVWEASPLYLTKRQGTKGEGRVKSPWTQMPCLGCPLLMET